MNYKSYFKKFRWNLGGKLCVSDTIIELFHYFSLYIGLLLLNRLSQQQNPFDVKDAFSINFNDILNSEIYNEGYTKTLPELKNIKAKQIGINFLLS